MEEIIKTPESATFVIVVVLAVLNLLLIAATGVMSFLVKRLISSYDMSVTRLSSELKDVQRTNIELKVAFEHRMTSVEKDVQYLYRDIGIIQKRPS